MDGQSYAFQPTIFVPVTTWEKIRPQSEAELNFTDATANVVYRERLEVARAQMLEGQGFAQPLIDTELFPGAARQMFKVGEETGTLDMQLEVAATYFDRELESRIKKFTTMFEPLMIIFVGVIVGSPLGGRFGSGIEVTRRKSIMSPLKTRVQRWSRCSALSWRWRRSRSKGRSNRKPSNREICPVAFFLPSER